MVYTEKVCKTGYDINLSIYALKIHIKDNLSTEVFFTPAEILVRRVMPQEYKE